MENKMEKRITERRIEIDSVFKKFKIGFKKNQGALSKLISFFSGKEPKKILLAVKGVSFTLDSGKILGIIGDNGSGKSTLLRIIARVYSPNSGRILTRGKIVSLINLNIGMQERLTMSENIFLLGSLFSLSQEMIKKRFNSIVEFAELEDFINTKLYQFSSGMLQRLAFSIAMHCNPEILLLDEVFAVGDKDFRKKSIKKIQEIVNLGCSVVWVSHDLNTMKKYCEEIIWMEKGQVIKQGKASEIIKMYLEKKK